MSSFWSSSFGKKLLCLMSITTAEPTDYVIIQKDTEGDRFTRKMLLSDFLDLIESNDSETVKEVSGDYTALVTDDYVVGENAITLTFPLLTDAFKSITFKNDGIVPITLDGNGSSIQNGTNLAVDTARKFIRTTSGWSEVT